MNEYFLNNYHKINDGKNPKNQKPKPKPKTKIEI